jgi:hypothetical protein
MLKASKCAGGNCVSWKPFTRLLFWHQKVRLGFFANGLALGLRVRRYNITVDHGVHESSGNAHFSGSVW